MRLTFSELAIADQDDISAYTFGKWGQEQLEDYMGGLIDLFDLIADKPTIGRLIPKLPKRFRRVPYGSHFVFYTAHLDAVRIERVLHQRMDYQRHLR
jgi:toxin ParE1/3/4